MFKILKVLETRLYPNIYKIVCLPIWVRVTILGCLAAVIFMVFEWSIFHDLLRRKKNYLNEMIQLSDEISKRKSNKAEFLNEQKLYNLLKNMKNKTSTDIFKFVDEMSKKNDLNLVSIKPDAQNDLEGDYNFKKDGYKIIVTGNYINLIEFVKDIAEASQFVFFGDFMLEITNAAPQNNMALQLILDISIFRERND